MFHGAGITNRRRHHTERIRSAWQKTGALALHAANHECYAHGSAEEQRGHGAKKMRSVHFLL